MIESLLSVISQEKGLLTLEGSIFNYKISEFYYEFPMYGHWFQIVFVIRIFNHTNIKILLLNRSIILT